MDAIDTSSVVDATVESCRRPLHIPDADGDRAMLARPWAPFDSIVDDRPVLVLSIMPVMPNLSACGYRNVGRPAIVARGLRFVTAFAYDPTRDPRSAVVLSRLRAVRATMLARAPLTVLTRDGFPRRTVDQLRLYIPYDAFAPDAAGNIPPVELLIWTKAGGPPTHIPLPADIMLAVWRDNLRWRAARLAAFDRAAATLPAGTHRALLPVPTPTDTALRTAVRFEQQHRDAAGASITLERLTDAKLTLNDRRIALMSLATIFQADDDAPAAAMLANELLTIDPCALSGTSESGGAPVENDAYSGMRAAGGLLDGLRPAARCTASPPWVSLVRGLIQATASTADGRVPSDSPPGSSRRPGAVTAFTFLHERRPA